MRAVSILAMLALTALGCSDPAVNPAAQGSSGAGASGGGAAVGDAPVVGVPETDCPAGERPLDDGTCLPPGVPVDGCGDGFVHDDDGAGCLAVVPDDPCPDGMMALPGDAACREVGPCGSGTWGDIPIDADTQHVDQNYTGGGNDGSASAPWRNLNAAISAAAPGATIAIAAGTYDGARTLDKPVTLWGKCAAEVTLASGGNTLYIRRDATGTELRGLSIRAGFIGVLAENVASITLDEVRIHDTGWVGFYLYSTGPNQPVATGTLSRSLLERTHNQAVLALGATLDITDVEVREVGDDGAGESGRGIYAQYDATAERAAVVQVRHARVSGTTSEGIRFGGSTGLVERSFVHDVDPEPGTGINGSGVWIGRGGTPVASDVEVRQTVVEDVHNSGIGFQDATGSVEACSVRRVATPPVSAAGVGVLVADTPFSAGSSSATIRSSSFEDLLEYGVVVLASEATLESVAVADVTSMQEGVAAGAGIAFQGDAAVVRAASGTVRWSRAERAVGYGVAVASSDVVLESVAVADIAPNLSGRTGRGIGVEADPAYAVQATLSIDGARIENVHEVGVLVLGAEATIRGAFIDGVLPTLGFAGSGILAQTDYAATGIAGTATVDRSTVRGAATAGILTIGGDLTVTGTLVDAVTPGDTGLYGDGVIATAATAGGAVASFGRVAVSDSIIRSSARAGVSSFGAEVELDGSWVECNPIAINGEVFGDDFTFTDGGGNSCFCGEAIDVCKLVSSNLEPPPAL